MIRFVFADATSRLDSVTGRSWPMTPLTGGDNLEGQVLLEPVLHLTIPHIQETVGHYWRHII